MTEPGIRHKFFKRAEATFLGAFAPFAWAAMPLLVLSLPGIPAFAMTAIVFSLASLIGIVIWIVSKQNLSYLLKLPLSFWLLGIWGIFGFHFCYFLMLRLAPPAEGFLICNIWQVLLLFMSSYLLKERIHSYHIIGAILGFSGVLVIAFKDGLIVPSSDHLIGYALSLTGAFIWASYSALSHKFQHVPSNAVIGYFPIVAILSLVCHFLLEDSFTLPKDAFSWQVFFAIAIGPGSFAFLAWDHGIKHGDIRLLSILSYIEPLLAVGLLVLFSFSVFSWHIALASCLIVGGSLIGSFGMIRAAKK
ncbi:MAG: rane protein [Rickettsiales bacterium]|jgi:drug/metabolite transporter (DMT)-like permease|nr:rane protein [Rickettsiales bacterium]